MCKSVNLYCQECRARGWADHIFATAIVENRKLLLTVPGYPAKIKDGLIYCSVCMSGFRWRAATWSMERLAQQFAKVDISEPT